MAPTTAAPQTVDLAHDHPRLTEPEVRRHLNRDHGWSTIDTYWRTYFGCLVAHLAEHRKARMRVSP